jgi:hypothetical protein
MKKGILLTMLLALFCWMFAVERDANTVLASVGQTELNNTTVRFSTPVKITGAVLVDTVTSSVSIPKFADLRGITIVVSDTVESRGDSALVKFFIGSTEIFSQMTSAFKLGVSTAPRTFHFTPSALYSPLNGGALSYRITQSNYAGADGITEGTFYFILEYVSPFKSKTLP